MCTAIQYHSLVFRLSFYSLLSIEIYGGREKKEFERLTEWDEMGRCSIVKHNILHRKIFFSLYFFCSQSLIAVVLLQIKTWTVDQVIKFRSTHLLSKEIVLLHFAFSHSVCIRSYLFRSICAARRRTMTNRKYFSYSFISLAMSCLIGTDIRLGVNSRINSCISFFFEYFISVSLIIYLSIDAMNMCVCERESSLQRWKLKVIKCMNIVIIVHMRVFGERKRSLSDEA